jgi:galactarate dehydratase
MLAVMTAFLVIKMATRTELANRWYDLNGYQRCTIAATEESIEDGGLKRSTS